MSGSKSTEFLATNGIQNIELSAGIYEENILDCLVKIKKEFNSISFTLHNYFPVPKQPFVFNLASLNNRIRAKSMRHALNAIDLAANVGAGIYSFHAGYLIDPKPRELGGKLHKQQINRRDESIDMFLNNLDTIAKYSSNRDIKIFVENNVLTKKNLLAFKENPLLMTHCSEIKDIFSAFPQNVGILIDVGHLKVSSMTFGLDATQELESLLPITSGYHISDNDGKSDSNLTFTKGSWFNKIIRTDLEYYVIEVYRESPETLKKQIDLLASII